MGNDKVWLLLLLQLLSAFSVSAEYDPKCKEEKRFQDKYFSELEAQQDLHNANHLSSVNIEFSQPSYIKSWTVKGRIGPNEGPIQNRSGLILKYTVKYGNKEGIWVPVGPTENDHEFMNDGNLAKPDFETKVSFEQPINTKSVKFFPQLWDGSPYMAVHVVYCIDQKDHSLWKEMEISKNLIVKALMKVEMIKKKAEKEKAKKEKAEVKEKNGDTKKGSENEKMSNFDPKSTIKETFAQAENKNTEDDFKIEDDDEEDEGDEDEDDEEDEDEEDENEEFDEEDENEKFDEEDENDEGEDEEDVDEGKDEEEVEGGEDEEDEDEEGKEDDDKEGKDDEDKEGKEDNDEDKEGKEDEEDDDIEEEDTRMCHTSVVWRYNGEKQIDDNFSSSTGSSTAYRLALSNLENPFLFPAREKREYAQVKFAAPSRVTMLRTVGKSDSGDWGLVTQFSLFYRNDKDEKWRYYTDDDGTRRLFDTKEKGKLSAIVPEEFNLPRPIVAKLIRLYPHKWSGKPYMSIDVKACYLSDPYPEFKYCSDSLLSQDDSLLAITFGNLDDKKELGNYQRYRTLELEGIEDESLVTGVKVRLLSYEDDTTLDFVKSFAMQYLNTDDEWKNVVDDDGIVKIFHSYSEEPQDTAILKFSDPVETGYLRVYPESWTGPRPVLFIDVLGCTDF